MNDLPQRSNLISQRKSDLQTHLDADRQTIYKFFLTAVRTTSSDEVLALFRRLFVFGDAADRVATHEGVSPAIV
ncbi:MAG TPA: hypothetical protein IGS17_18870 [Oscillatoriales cyanobacterium M59_W2019_021]|nr:MAG: hypothetical protein D6728_15305 [Cyanobacteria bacterium J055]HIK30814.1 hypothetical protein [Oscillatoriales cyanobacterium M4454_W2019_049]HIK52960.1 hypothetical protein [Oscillatoriales cyanobacterium M59_W2019_021]